MKIFIILASYLIGSISFAGIIARFKKIDLKANGTKNPGATNVYRMIGPFYGIFTGVLDFSKGFIPTYLAKYIFEFDFSLVIMIALSIIVGHNWSIFNNFAGGRGLATSMGTLAAIEFYPALIAFIIGGSISLFLLKYFHIKIRIPYIVYPIYLSYVFFYQMQSLLLFYGFAVMAIAMLRGWQVRKRYI